MTGKEFFGKLLNNRQENESPWPSEEAHEDAPPHVHDVEDRPNGERHDASDGGSYDESTRTGHASYVDAPVTELRAPESSQSHSDIDKGEPQRRDLPVERRGSADAAQPEYQVSNESNDAEQIWEAGGDGLTTDLPDVRPSKGYEDGSAQIRHSSAQFGAVQEDAPAPERSATEYLAQEQETQQYGHQSNSTLNENSDTLNETASHPQEKDASAYLDQGAAPKMQDPHADEVVDHEHIAENAGSQQRHDANRQETNGLPPQAPHQPSQEAHSEAPSTPTPPQQSAVEHGETNGSITYEQETSGENTVAPVRQVPSSHPAPTTDPTPPPTQADAPTPPRTPDSQHDSKEGAAKKESTSSSKASKVSDADVKNVKDRVVHRLLEKNVITVDQVKNALADRNKQGLKATLWRILAQQATVDRERVYREAALTYAFEERKIDEGSIDVDFIRQVADVFPEKKRNRLIELHIVPIGYEFEQQTQLLRVVFITHDPSLPVVRELMQDLNLERYELQYASESTVKDLLARAFPKKNEYLERMTDDPLAYDLGTSFEDEKSELIDEDALEAEINRSSLINLFEGALVEAVHRGASDIHIYPNPRRQIEIHFRVDGRLLHWHTEDKIHPESLLAVIKDNTMNVDRFERDMAQDGFIQRKVDDTLIRYRVSILPIASASNNIHAESIVIRVLDDRKVITDLSKLGLLKGALERFDMAIRQPHGMVILTGPTGSGKSTTLVASLHQVVTPEVNVLTVEDPVEYIIPGVRQIKLNHKLGLEGALRAILRHDPDVVMVGEMRDKATAELAVKLANTGHLTFSTLHTNDAPSAVSRLYKMGLEPFLIAYAINLVVAQRLLRTLCPKCKIVDNDPDHVLLERLGFTHEDLKEYTIFKASGDPTCKTCKGMGYKGRRAISEAMYFSREIRHMIVESDTKIDEDGLRDMARQEGMLTLQDSAREVVKMGETSVDEMMRVTMTEE